MTIDFSVERTIPQGADLLAVAVFEGKITGPGGFALEGDFMRKRSFKASVGESLAWPGGSRAETILALGLGSRSEFDAEGLRKAAAQLVRSAWDCRKAVLFLGDSAQDLGSYMVGQAIAEGVVMAAYNFGRHKTKPNACTLEEVVVVVDDESDISHGMRRGRSIAEAVCLARDLVNESACDLTPTEMADRALQIGQRCGLTVEAWDEEKIVQEKLGGIMGVAKGSDEAPRMVRLEFVPSQADTSTPTIAFVGKGITFDSGGLSLKSAGGMETMKTDMGGAAAVLAAMSVLRELNVQVRVIGFLALAENMPSGKATRPGDVLRIRNGKTIEVLNTDAEGRLVLADVLSLAAEENPSAIVDLATLTGACVVALGREIAGLMGNSEALVHQVRDAAKRSGERVWHLPLPAEYRSHIDSEVADMKNIGAPGQAGSLSAALLLKEFVGDKPWVHLDIAGPARSYEERGYVHKGGTGFGVRTLLELVSTFRSDVTEQR